MATFKCRCGHTQDQPPARIRGVGVVCYVCADSHVRKEMSAGKNRIAAYLSPDCKSIQTFTGGFLVNVTRLIVRRGRKRNGEPLARYYWRGYSAGRYWFGVSQGPNMLTMMRAGAKS